MRRATTWKRSPRCVERSTSSDIAAKPPDVQPRLILVEGIPGSGKSSVAEWICRELPARGVKVHYHPELPRERSVLDGPIMATARSRGYADRCVARWREFVGEVLADPDESVRVVEGCFFQSAVRFLLEHQHPDGESERYMAESEQALLPLAPHLLYLVHRDIARYLREEIIERKGADTLSKIAIYTETTSWARQRGVEGIDALVAFYQRYRRVCDGLVNASFMPRLVEDTSDGDWSRLHTHVGAWLDKSWPRSGAQARPMNRPHPPTGNT